MSILTLTKLGHSAGQEISLPEYSYVIWENQAFASLGGFSKIQTCTMLFKKENDSGLHQRPRGPEMKHGQEMRHARHEAEV